MATKAELQSLLERVEAATGPDREIDFWLSIRFGEPTRHTDAELQADIDTVGIEEMVIDAPFTASIDAALGLVERVLPGTEYEITNLYGVASASLPMNDSMLPYETGRNECGSLPLAILAALLRALIAQADEVEA